MYRHILRNPIFLLATLLVIFEAQAQRPGFGPTSPRRRQMPEQPFQRALDEIDSLVFIKQDLDAALQKCRAVRLEMIDNYYSHRTWIEAVINLAENYSDYDQQPLKLYFKARSLGGKGWPGRERTLETEAREAAFLQQLLQQFPECKLAASAQYLLAASYESQFRHSANEEFRQKAIAAYEVVAERFSGARFPLACNYSNEYYQTLEIAPSALWHMAYIYWEMPDMSNAVSSYQKIVDNYPNAVDSDNNRTALAAYASLLSIYADAEGILTDTIKARAICQTLLEIRPNQKFETGGYFGWIHPEAYMRLAQMESDTAEALRLYRLMIADYPECWMGKSNSGGVSPYFASALDQLLRRIPDPLDKVSACAAIIQKVPRKDIKGGAQSHIAHIYYDLGNLDQALLEFQKVVDLYGDADFDGEGFSLGDAAKSYIEMIQQRKKE